MIGRPASPSFRFKAALQALLGIGYPILIFLSLSWFEPRETALAVLGLATLRFAIARPAVAASAVREVWILALGVAAVVGTTAILNDPIGLLMTPVLINAVFLLTFGSSLRRGRTMVERFARLQVGTLSEEEVRYCRTVTWIWCAFFVFNGAVCLLLALSRNLKAWTLYTGFISYGLMGLLFGVEYVHRHARFRRYVGGFADPLLKRFFPPTSTQASSPPAQATPLDPGTDRAEPGREAGKRG
jgi:uncharacterized membrane protein